MNATQRAEEKPKMKEDLPCHNSETLVCMKYKVRWCTVELGLFSQFQLFPAPVHSHIREQGSLVFLYS